MFFGVQSGETRPPDIRSFAASSVGMSSSMIFFLSTKIRKPAVGIGVGGRKTSVISMPIALKSRGNLALGVGGHEHHRPEAGRRVFDHADFLERIRPLAKNSFEELLQALVERPDERCPIDDGLAELDDRTADEVLGEEADDGDDDDSRQQAEARNRELDIVLRPVLHRNERPDPAIRPLDQRPGQPDGDCDGGANDEPGQEIVAKLDAERLLVRRLSHPSVPNSSAKPMNSVRLLRRTRTNHSTVTDLARFRG